MDAHPILTLLLASPGERWGPVLGSVTVLDVLLVLLVLAAAVRGWRLGISRVVLGVGGLLAGLWAGLWAAVHLVPTGLSPAAALSLEVVAVVVGALVGSAVGGAVGVMTARLLSAVHLRLPDRAAGFVARGALALVVCWTLVAGVAALAPGRAGSDARTLAEGSSVLSLASRATPTVDRLHQRVVADGLLPAPAR